MPWFDGFFEPPFINWLRRLAESGRYTRQVPSDPFATSMRDLDDVAPNLLQLRSGSSIDSQRHTDLKAAQLVDSGKLTPLGDAVLDGWHRHSAANTNYSDELPRQLVLICEALKNRNPFYLGVRDFWRERFSRYGADEVIEKWEASFALPFLANRMGGDYSPLSEHESRSSTIPDWSTSEIERKVRAALPAGDPAIDGIVRLKVIDGLVSRGKARQIFLMALYLALTGDPSEAKAKLAVWKIPATSTSRHPAPIPVPTQNKCLDILDEYRSVLGQNLTAFAQLNLLKSRKNVVFFGPPGTGKTYAAQEIAAYWRGMYGPDSVVVLTFHPSYSYEDFVWGWRPDPTMASGFGPKEGALLEACKRAEDGQPVLLLIDEINRADTARVFGELITYIEADKRDLPFWIAQDPAVPRVIPSSLHLLGTMNTADRSVSLLDVALRRRFAFVEFEPSGSAYLTHPGWASDVGGVPLSKLLDGLNSRLSRAGIEPDRAIGQALLSVPSDAADPLAALRERLQFDVHPLVVDYCFSDRSRVEQVLKPLVTPEGRFRAMSESDFVVGIAEIAGVSLLPSQPAAVPPSAQSAPSPSPAAGPASSTPLSAPSP